jgi:hypothetical protein
MILIIFFYLSVLRIMDPYKSSNYLDLSLKENLHHADSRSSTMQCFILVTTLILINNFKLTFANVICLFLLICFNLYGFFFIMGRVIEGLPFEFLDWVRY